MTKEIFKLVSFVTAFCVLLTVIPFAAYAEDKKISLTAESIQFNPETELEMSFSASAIPQFSGTTNSEEGWLFYNQLTDAQKVFYQAIYNAGVSETITVQPETAYTGTGFTDNSAFNAALGKAMEDVIAAITAVAEDNPMIFWINGFGLSGEGTVSGSVIKTAKVTSVQITIALDENSYADFSVVQQKYDELWAAVEKFQVNGFNRYEKLKSINDRLCDMVTYPENQGTSTAPDYGPMAHQPTGALLNGSAVCEGYAEALKLICDREGIPCITAVGTGGGGAHKWNYVQMDDGLWYLVDATWNDQITFKTYNWFITGSALDGGDHINTGQLYAGYDFTLSYPTLSSDNYGYAILMKDSPDLAFLNTENVLYVGKGLTNYLDYLGFTSNLSGSVTSSSVTGAKLTITNTDTSTSRTYLVAMRGDINSNSSVNSADYMLAVKTAAAQYKLTDNSASFYAGDMNQDGAVDGFDAIAHELYTDGTLTFE